MYLMEEEGGMLRASSSDPSPLRLHPLVHKKKGEFPTFCPFLQKLAPTSNLFLPPPFLLFNFQASGSCRMRPAMAVASLLLLLLLVATTQGIRLEGESSGAFQKKLQEENGSVVGTPGGGTALCREDGQCSGLSSRKLLTETKAAPKSTRSEGVEADHSQKLRPEEEAAGVPVKPAASEHKNTGTETYPDLMDIAGMDYSPAERKPPIHN